MPIFLNFNDKLRQSGLNSNTLTKCIGDGWNNAAYSRKWISNDNEINLYSWNIKINKGDRNIYVGIVSDSHHQQNRDFDTKHSYAIDITNGRINVNGKLHGFHGHSCGEGDIFTFNINVKEGQLECIKNHNIADKRILAENLKFDENVKYRLALNIYYKQNQVTVSDNNDVGDINDDHHHNIDDSLFQRKKYEDLEMKDTMKCVKKLENEILRMQEMIEEIINNYYKNNFNFWII